MEKLPGTDYDGEAYGIPIATRPVPSHCYGWCGTHCGYLYIGDSIKVDDYNNPRYDFYPIHGGWTFTDKGWIGFDTMHDHSDASMNQAWVIDELTKAAKAWSERTEK